jgi:hypothetical protein
VAVSCRRPTDLALLRLPPFEASKHPIPEYNTFSLKENPRPHHPVASSGLRVGTMLVSGVRDVAYSFEQNQREREDLFNARESIDLCDADSERLGEMKDFRVASGAHVFYPYILLSRFLSRSTPLRSPSYPLCAVLRV